MSVPLPYSELQCLTNFSFLEGASHPGELAIQAKALGLEAIGIADRNSLAGVVRAHKAAKEVEIRLLVGARLDLVDGYSILAYPKDRAAYGRLSRLITVGRRRAEKGECRLARADIAEWGAGMVLIVLGRDGPVETKSSPDPLEDQLRDLQPIVGADLYLAVQCRMDGTDEEALDRLARLARRTEVPIVATNDVVMHEAARRPLADVLACIRLKTTIDRAGRLLHRNGERRLKSPREMRALFSSWAEGAAWIATTREIVDKVSFSLDELRYDYPEEITEPGKTAQQSLVEAAWRGAAERYPGGVPEKVRNVLQYELDLIESLGYAPYFLTVHDLVRFARERDILCQGRGSAANSAVCYCLGVTAVDPSRLDLLFERFVSAERDEPPDIDVDFEHERREEVIQYVYEKYGRTRTGMTATVICYRSRGAIRDVGKAMGLSEDVVAHMAAQVWGWSEPIDDQRLKEVGLDPTDRRLRMTLDLIRQVIGFPRHLSQHVGGMVMTRDRLDSVVPIENAAMADRTVIQWDKDDLDALGILKVDILSLGMLTCLRKGFDLIRAHYGRSFTLATVPPADKAVYDMLCRADSLGVFQVESRAQMAFLPRMKPRNFYDLVIEVAIVRPGPIQGDMVHPYLRRRNGEEEVGFSSPELERVLSKTLGVPLFQEQAMQVAITAAGFTPSEADRLRRAMATFRKTGIIHEFRDKMVRGMIDNDYEPEFAERCFRQIEGFGEYGFPESHAASFALLVYVSAWMKHRYPAVFACALLNSQPMGFYAPAQIVRDAAEHGIEIRPADVNRSDWDATLEVGEAAIGVGGGDYALRLGLRQIKGLSKEDGDFIVACRANGYLRPSDLWRRAGLAKRALSALARADAFGSMELNRREAWWNVAGFGGDKPLPLFAHALENGGSGDAGEDGGGEWAGEPVFHLPKADLGEEVAEDYAALRLSLKAHPMALLRERGDASLSGHAPAKALREMKDGTRNVTVSGLVLVRQRPGSAKGVIFATLEDETGVSNIVIWKDCFEKFRSAILAARLMQVRGKLQRDGIVHHLIADEIRDRSDLLDSLMYGDGPGETEGAGSRPAVPVDGFRGTGYHPVHSPTKTVSRKSTPRPRHPRDQARVIF